MMLASHPVLHTLGGTAPLRLVAAGGVAPGLAVARAGAALALEADDVTWSAAAANTPRFRGAARRLLVEGARTNANPNPRAEGAAAGTPGTGPTGWSLTSTANGVARQIVGSGTEGGLPYLEVRIAGTPTASSSMSLSASGTNVIAAAAGQSWTAQIFARLTAGSLAGAAIQNLTRYRDAGGTILGSSIVVVTPTGAALGGQRSAVTRSMPANTAFVQQICVVNYVSGVALDLTLRVFMQHEQGAFASSPVLPPAGTPAASTRAADAPSLALSASQGARGTLAGTFLLPQTAPAEAEQGLLQLDDGTDANRIVLRNAAGSGAVEAVIVSGGTVAATLAGGTVTAGLPFRAALGWSPAGVALCLAGGAVQSAATLPAGLSRLLLGHGNAALTRAAFGEIGPLDLHPGRLPDDSLQALTA